MAARQIWGQRSTWQPQGGRLQYEWCVNRHAEVKRLLVDVLSYLIAKFQRARLMLAWLADKKDSSWLSLISTNTRTIHPVRAKVTDGAMVPQLGQSTIRHSQAQRVLVGDAPVIADHTLVDAQDTRRLLRELVNDGYTKTRIAKCLGSKARVPALHFRGDCVLAKTALRVRRLHALLFAEGGGLPSPKPFSPKGRRAKPQQEMHVLRGSSCPPFDREIL